MPEGLNKSEVKKTIENIHDLLSLSSVEKNRLKKRIEKWDGLVRIFVHPMYEKWRGHEEKYINDPEEVKLVEIERVLSKLIAMPESKTPPIIIMEERIFIKKLEKWLVENPQGSSQKGIYFVKTRLNNPAPDLEIKEAYFHPSPDTEAWKPLSDTLRELGVRKILLGGIKLGVLFHKKDWTQKDPFLEFCVGIAMSHLSKDKGGEFEVELSALTFPTEERNNFSNFKRENQEKK